MSFRSFCGGTGTTVKLRLLLRDLNTIQRRLSRGRSVGVGVGDKGREIVQHCASDKKLFGFTSIKLCYNKMNRFFFILLF